MEWLWSIVYQDTSNIVIRLKSKLTHDYAKWSDVFIKYNDPILINGLIKILSNTSFDEYYMEFNPTTLEQSNSTEFEFILIKTNGFSSKADLITFGIKKINTNSNDIIIFPNLSNSTLLVVPCFNNLFPTNDYIHIGKFMRSQNIKQKFNLINSMFKTYLNELTFQPNKKLWLSTHGKGVSWLHVRIDKTPKYIMCKEYR